MRKALLILSVFILAGSMLAADPIIGAWKLNIAKSKFLPTRPVPKELTEVYRELPDGQIELTWKNTQADGSSILQVFAFPAQGGMVKVLKGDTPNSFVQTRISEDEWWVTYLLEGKQVMTRHKLISKDRKTLRQTLKGVDDEGKSFELMLVYDKQ